MSTSLVVTRYLHVIAATIFIVSLAGICHSGDVITIDRFENSSFGHEFKFKEKKSWILNTGGKNFSYTYVDPENTYSSIGVELSSDENNITVMSILWNGESTLSPAKLTQTKQKMLEKLILSIIPDLKIQDVVNYSIQQQGISYPGGGNTMPRKRVGKYDIHAGHVGQTLIVGIEVPK